MHDSNIDLKEIKYDSQNACRLVCGRFGGLWPRPTNFAMLGQALVSFNPRYFRFETKHIPSEVASFVEDINNIFIDKLGRECATASCTSSKLEKEVVVEEVVRSNGTILSWEINESYRLDIVSRGNQVSVQIDADTVFGLRHGLETLNQLIAADTSESGGLLIVASARIEDAPIYRHRGLLIDTARNFIPIVDLERTLDGMGASKLNVFHWHITDAQSFPLEIPSQPQMTRFGAYSAKEIYSADDVKRIIEYAKLRGVRVIVEIDAPAHAGNGWNWGRLYGHGDLAVCVNQQPWRQFCIQPPCGQLNPVNHVLFEILRNVYRDIIEMLPHAETLHMGGDEVHFGCWNSSTEITDYLRRHGLGREEKDFLGLWAGFQQAALRIWDEENGQNPSSRRDTHETPKKMILWSSRLTDFEHIEQYLEKDRYVIQTWVENTDELPRQLLERGYELIMSTKNAWYFDHGFWGRTPYYQWQKVYENELPTDPGILGGEACVWSELIDTNNLGKSTYVFSR